MNKAFVNSLPKAGTHLLEKCLELFGYSKRGHLGASLIVGKDIRSRIRNVLLTPRGKSYKIGIDSPVDLDMNKIVKKLKKINSNQFYTGHIGYKDDLLRKILELNFRPIVVVRDPRAVLASFVPYVIKNRQHIMHESFISMVEQEQYLNAFKGYKTQSAELLPLRTRCEALDSWIKSKNVLKIRFEDIVGTKGGGSGSKQRKTLEHICDWLDAPRNMVQFVSDNLFGPGKNTFRKGQIDSWRFELPEGIIDSSSEELRDILNEWGYS